jgi:hypothetical protein
MKLSENTRAILNNFVLFNQSIVIREGNVLSTITHQKTALVAAIVEETFPVECAIYDLRKALGLISLFENPDLTFEKSFVQIKDEKKSVNVRYAEINCIIAPPNNNIEEVEPDASFVLEAKDLVSILKAQSILGSPNIVFQGDGERILVAAMNSKDSTADIFSLDVGPTLKEFSVMLKTENMKMIPMDYNIEVSKNRVKFASTDSKLRYYFATEI